MPETKPFEALWGELKRRKPEGAFRPCGWYNATGDSLEIYLSTEPYIAERVDTLLTIFVSAHDRYRVVGLAIKNIKKHFGASGLTDVFFSSKRAKVALLLLGVRHQYQAHREGQHGRGRRLAPASRISGILQGIGNAEVDLRNLTAAGLRE